MDSWLLKDVDETLHSGIVQLETYPPSADTFAGGLIVDSDTEDAMYVVPELRTSLTVTDRGMHCSQLHVPCVALHAPSLAS